MSDYWSRLRAEQNKMNEARVAYGVRLGEKYLPRLLVTVPDLGKRTLKALAGFPCKEDQKFEEYERGPQGIVLKMQLDADDLTVEQDEYLNTCKAVVNILVW